MMWRGVQGGGGAEGGTGEGPFCPADDVGRGARPAGGLRVTVGDPQAVPDETGSLKKTYTSYLVSGYSTLPGYPRRDFQARREFSTLSPPTRHCLGGHCRATPSFP